LFVFFFPTTFLVKQAFVLGVHPLPRRRHERFLHSHDNFSSLPSFIQLCSGVGRGDHSTILRQFLVALPTLPLVPTLATSKNLQTMHKFHLPSSTFL
jgi:hypothetical protein